METVVEHSRTTCLKAIEFGLATNTADYGISAISNHSLG